MTITNPSIFYHHTSHTIVMQTFPRIKSQKWFLRMSIYPAPLCFLKTFPFLKACQRPTFTFLFKKPYKIPKIFFLIFCYRKLSNMPRPKNSENSNNSKGVSHRFLPPISPMWWGIGVTMGVIPSQWPPHPPIPLRPLPHLIQRTTLHYHHHHPTITTTSILLHHPVDGPHLHPPHMRPQQTAILLAYMGEQAKDNLRSL